MEERHDSRTETADCKQENAMHKKLKGKTLENYDTFLLTIILKKYFDKCSFIATTFCLKS